MGFLNWLRPKPRQTENHTICSSYSFLFGPTSSGRPVTERSAMQMTAVYSCVRILAEAIAGLPLHVYRYKEGYRTFRVAGVSPRCCGRGWRGGVR